METKYSYTSIRKSYEDIFNREPEKKEYINICSSFTDLQKIADRLYEILIQKEYKGFYQFELEIIRKNINAFRRMNNVYLTYYEPKNGLKTQKAKYEILALSSYTSINYYGEYFKKTPGRVPLDCHCLDEFLQIYYALKLFYSVRFEKLKKIKADKILLQLIEKMQYCYNKYYRYYSLTAAYMACYPGPYERRDTTYEIENIKYIIQNKKLFIEFWTLQIIEIETRLNGIKLLERTSYKELLANVINAYDTLNFESMITNYKLLADKYLLETKDVDLYSKGSLLVDLTQLCLPPTIDEEYHIGKYEEFVNFINKYKQQNLDIKKLFSIFSEKQRITILERMIKQTAILLNELHKSSDEKSQELFKEIYEYEINVTVSGSHFDLWRKLNIIPALKSAIKLLKGNIKGDVSNFNPKDYDSILYKFWTCFKYVSPLSSSSDSETLITCIPYFIYEIENRPSTEKKEYFDKLLKALNECDYQGIKENLIKLSSILKRKSITNAIERMEEEEKKFRKEWNKYFHFKF